MTQPLQDPGAPGDPLGSGKRLQQAVKAEERFRPAWWLPGPHLQTIWPVLFRPRVRLDGETERLELPDGDFLDLLWQRSGRGPTILVLHGLEGSVRSHYASGLLSALAREGYRYVFMHFRGCSGRPNRLPRGYHSGETGDLSRVIGHVAERTGEPPAAIVGFSLGGNVLLKWLGEQGPGAPVRGAVAVSVPFLLDDCARRLDRGLSRLYRDYLLRRLRRSYRAKFGRMRSPLEVDVGELRTFREFDHGVTAPLHGFRGVDHYYRDSSSRQFISRITVPTLILHAADDPFMWPKTIPDPAELSGSVKLEVNGRGGHVGFIGGRVPWRPDYWLERRIIRYLKETLG